MLCTCCRQTLHSIPRVCYTPWWYWGESKHNLWLKNLQNEIESGRVKQTTRYWLSLPTLEAHEKTHPVKQAAVFSQKVNPAVAQIIVELLADGITEIDDVKKALQHRINQHDITEKFQEKLPSQDGLLLIATQTQKQALRTKKKHKWISSKLKLEQIPRDMDEKEWTPSSGIVLGFEPASCGRYAYIYTGFL